MRLRRASSAALPELRGRLTAERSRWPTLTWFRVGGPARGAVHAGRRGRSGRTSCKRLPADVPVTVVGVGSNLLVRDGGVPGVVDPASAAGFGEVDVETATRIRAGAAVPDVQGRARGARGRHRRASHSIAAFPARIGGALRMNAGAYGARDQGRAGRGARRRPRRATCTCFSNADMGYTYRHCGAPEDLIFTAGAVPGRAGRPGDDRAPRWTRSPSHREATQPIRERTGGSTFKNPPGHRAWKLIDAAGCRGLARRRRAGVGDALQLPDQPPATPPATTSRRWARPCARA